LVAVALEKLKRETQTTELLSSKYIIPLSSTQFMIVWFLQ